MKETIDCNFRIDSDPISGDLFLLPDETYTLTIDYPLHSPAKIDIYTKDGMYTAAVINKIIECYKKVYEDADTTNKHGIWRHDIGDLWLEAIHIDHDMKTIKLGMGSC